MVGVEPGAMVVGKFAGVQSDLSRRAVDLASGGTEGWRGKERESGVIGISRWSLCVCVYVPLPVTQKNVAAGPCFLRAGTRSCRAGHEVRAL